MITPRIVGQLKWLLMWGNCYRGSVALTRRAILKSFVSFSGNRGNQCHLLWYQTKQKNHNIIIHKLYKHFCIAGVLSMVQCLLISRYFQTIAPNRYHPTRARRNCCHCWSARRTRITTQHTHTPTDEFNWTERYVQWPVPLPTFPPWMMFRATGFSPQDAF